MSTNVLTMNTCTSFSSSITATKYDLLQLQTLELSELEQIVRPVLFKGKVLENGVDISDQAFMLRSLMGHLYIHHSSTNNDEKVDPTSMKSDNIVADAEVVHHQQQSDEPIPIDADQNSSLSHHIVGFHDLASEEWVRTKVIPHCIFMLLNRKASLLGTQGWNVSSNSATTANSTSGMLNFYRLGRPSLCMPDNKNISTEGLFCSDSVLRAIGLHFGQFECDLEQLDDLQQQSASDSTTIPSPPLHVIFLLAFIELSCELFRHKGVNIVEDSDWLNLLHRILSVPSYFLSDTKGSESSTPDAIDTSSTFIQGQSGRNSNDVNIFSFSVALRRSERLTNHLNNTDTLKLDKYACNGDETIPFQYFIFLGGLDVIHMGLTHAGPSFQYPKMTDITTAKQLGLFSIHGHRLPVDGTKTPPTDLPPSASYQNIMLPRLSLLCYSLLLDIFDQLVLPFLLRNNASTTHRSDTNATVVQSLTSVASDLSSAFRNFLRSISPELDINGTSDRNLYLSLLHDLHNTGINISANIHYPRSPVTSTATSSSEAEKWSFLLEQQPPEPIILLKSSTSITATKADPSILALLLRLEGIFKMILSSSIQNKVAGIMELRVIIDNVETESKNVSKQQKRDQQGPATKLRDHFQLGHSIDRTATPENKNNYINTQANFFAPPADETSAIPLPSTEGGCGISGTTTLTVPPSSPTGLFHNEREYAEANLSDDNAQMLAGDVMDDHTSNYSGASESNVTSPAQNLFLLHTQGINSNRPFDITATGYDDTDDGSTKACCSDDELRDDATASSEDIRELANIPLERAITKGQADISHSRSKSKLRQKQCEELMAKKSFRGKEDVDVKGENCTTFFDSLEPDISKVCDKPMVPKSSDTSGIVDGVLYNALWNTFVGENNRVICKIQEYVSMLSDDLTVQEASIKEGPSLALSAAPAPQDFARQQNNCCTTAESIFRSPEAATKPSDISFSKLTPENTKEKTLETFQALDNATPKYHRSINTLLEFLLSPHAILHQIGAPSISPHGKLDAGDRSMIQLLTSPEFLHPQLLKRFLHILQFLADYHCIDPADLHSLWDTAIHPPSNQHESIQKTLIFDLWIPLLRGGKLSAEHLVYLYIEMNDSLFTDSSAFVNERGLPSVDNSVEEPKLTNVISIDLMIPVVLSFADAAFAIVFKTKSDLTSDESIHGSKFDMALVPIGLDLLWRLANEESSLILSKDLQDHVVRHLIETTGRLLASSFSDSKDSNSQLTGSPNDFSGILQTSPPKKCFFCTDHTLNWLLHRTIQQLQGNCSEGKHPRLPQNSTVCHLVLSKIISMWPQSRTRHATPSNYTRSEIIRRFDVLRKLIDDLRQYCSIVDCCLLSRDKTYLDVDCAVWVGSYYSHSMTVQTCLDLIRLIVSFEIASFCQDKFLTIASVGQRKRMRDDSLDKTKSINLLACSSKSNAFGKPQTSRAVTSSAAIVIDEDDDESCEVATKRINTGNTKGVELKDVDIVMLDYETALKDDSPSRDIVTLDCDTVQKDSSPFHQNSDVDTCIKGKACCTSSPLIFPEAEIREIVELLWATLMEQERSTIERVLYCDLLSSILKMAAEASLTSYVQRFSWTLLQNFLKQGGFDPSNTSCSALDLFALCLAYLPATKKEIDCEINQDSVAPERGRDTFIGADYLWEVILSVSSDAVASRAIGLLAQLFLSPTADYDETQRLHVVKLQSLFAAKCMTKLGALPFTLAKDSNSLPQCQSDHVDRECALGDATARILELLYVFASGVLKSFDESASASSTNSGDDHFDAAKNCKLSHRSLNASSLMESITPDNPVLESSTYTSKLSSTKLAPISVLLKKECFSIFFDLCGKIGHGATFDRKDQRVAWELLMLLPTDPWLYDCLFTRILTPAIHLLDYGWEAFLPLASASPFRLLYGLQIVEVFLIVCFKSAEQDNAQSPHVSIHYLLNHLITVLCEIDLSSNEQIEGGYLSSSQVVITLHCVVKLQKLVLLCFNRSDGNVGQPKEAVSPLSSDRYPLFAKEGGMLEPNGQLITRLLLHAVSIVHSTVELHTVFNGSQSNLSGISISEGVESELITVTMQSLRLLQFLCEEYNPSLVDVLLDGTSSNKVDGVHFTFFAKAVASAILRSASTELRDMACSVFQSVFLPSRGQTSIGESEIYGTVVSPSVPSNEYRFLSLLINMIPLVIEDGPLVYRCNNLFHLIDRVISKMWSDFVSLFKEGDVIESLIELSDDDLPCISELPSCFGVRSCYKILKWAMKLMLDLPIRETRTIPQQVDYLLVGMLTITEKLTRFLCVDLNIHVGCQKEFLRHVFSSLFNVAQGLADDDGCCQPQCKSYESRNAAMILLTSLFRSSFANANELSQQLLLQHAELSPRNDLMDEWYIDPIGKDKSVTGYVGLRNLGCTCYLNSLMQQLFLIAPFCDGILSCNAPSEGGVVAAEESNMLHQLQHLFSHLSISARRDYDPSGLVSTIKGYDGNPIRIGEQQDVDEFFNLFGDRLEKSLKFLPQKRLLQDIFGGKVSHIITCQDCKSISERLEDYLSLSLDVKGKPNILKSLDLYVEGEALDGSNQYFCQSCQAKRDSVKMACIKELPNVLILHLKRFEFDLELMRKVKLNERCEFPFVLNMRPYTKEGLSMQATIEGEKDGDTPRSIDYYEYFLRGVLVHSGTADSGHYYSIARKNVSSSDEPWFCFNDGSVSPFDLSTLPDAAFGGSGEKQKFDKAFSAYLLFYERKHIEFHDSTSPTEAQKTSGNASTAAINPTPPWHPNFHERFDSTKNVPSEILQTVKQENSLFLRDKMYFDPEYSRWLQILLETSLDDKVDEKILVNMVKVLTYQLLDTLVHSRNRGAAFDSLVKLLCVSYSSSYDASAWLLKIMTKTHLSWATSMLLRCPSVELRQDFVRILSAVFAKLAPSQRILYEFKIQLECTTKLLSVLNCGIPYVETEDADIDEDIVITFKGQPKEIRLGRLYWWESKSFLIHFVGTALIDILADCESSWRRFDQLFEALFAFASCGYQESLYLIRCGVILRLLDIYLGDTPGVPKGCLIAKKEWHDYGYPTNLCRPKMGDKYTHPNFAPLFSLLQHLVRSAVVSLCCESDSDSVSDSDDDQNGDKPKQCNREEFMEIPPKTFSPSTLIPDALDFIQSSVIGVERIELPCYDSNCLSTKKFLLTALSDKETNSVLQSHIKSILVHLCFENIQLSETVCVVVQEQFRDRKASEFGLALDVLFSLREIKDHHSAKRNFCVMRAVIFGVNENIKYDKEACAILNGLENALTRIKSTNLVTRSDKGFFETVFFDNFPSVLIEEWFKRPNTLSEVRNCIINVVKAFIASPAQNGEISLPQNELNVPRDDTVFDSDKLEHLCDLDMVKKKVLSSLITIFSYIREAIESQASNTKSGSFVDTRAFSSYFETLRMCLVGAEYEKAFFLDQFHGINKELAHLLWKIDEEGRRNKRPYEDIAKGELIALFGLILELYPEAGQELISDFVQKRVGSDIECIDVDNDVIQVITKRSEEDDSNHVSKLLELYVTANNRSNKWYNDTYMSRYYIILVLLAERHDIFRRKLLDHENWRWALRVFVLGETGSDSGPIFQVLLEKSKKFAFVDEKFRISLVPFLFMHDRDKRSFITQQGGIQTASLQLALTILKSEEGHQGSGEIMKLIIGNENGGLSQLSAAAAKFLDKLEGLEESMKTRSSTVENELRHILKGLMLAMQCIFFIMEKHGQSKVRALLSVWPEADDINILCHKLVTIGDEEWTENYGVCPGTDVFDYKGEIIKVASRILTMLNSVLH